MKRPRVNLKLGDTPFPHRLARTRREHAKNLELLFLLQQIAYPELRRGLVMDKSVFNRRALSKKDRR